MTDVELRENDFQESGRQQPNRRNTLLMGLAVCVSWFVLAIVSSMPSFYIAASNKDFVVGGVEYQTLDHSLRLVGGLLLVFALWPVLLRKYYASSRDYLQGSGVLMPRERQAQIALLVFGVVLAGLLVCDLASGTEGIVEFHKGLPLWYIIFTGFQAGIIEELLFRGVAFGVLRKRFPTWVAILLPAVFFGLAHSYWGIGRIFETMFIGALFALLRWRTDNIWGPVVMHGLLNVGFPVPIWVGWLAAMLITLALPAIKRFSKRAVGGLRTKT
ncbi:MAG: CPBP family intramembrane metalloprotease [Anaerolineae bacterium]|nr:CPBP family intramembrane metalloprotease [Anaerolineae bacterium]